MGSDDASSPSAGARRLAAVLAGTTLALGAGLVWLIRNPVGADPERMLELALNSDEIRNAAIDEIVATSDGVWDSFPDPDVGRVMQRNVADRDFRGVSVSSNALGMREEPYTLEKAAGTTRVVLLGDSFVYGYNVEAEDRLGVFLEDFLEQRGSGDVECLHVAATSWNVLAETAYLRRQLHVLQPDLVVQVVVVNDLDDCKGVRGFGSLASYSPQVRRRVGGLLSQLSPPQLWPKRLQTYLMFGLDHESRERYGEAAREIARLRDAVEAEGGKYLMLAAWESFNPMVEKHLAVGLDAEEVAYVSMSFTQDLRYRIDETDRHWNRAGHERIAMLVYGLAEARGLLPSLELAPWPDADAAVAEIHERGRAEASYVVEYSAALEAKAREQARSVIDFGALDRFAAKQVHAGLFAEGHVAPFASALMARGDGDKLHLTGKRLAPALLTGEARISVEGVEVGRIPLAGDPVDFDLRWPLPLGARERAFVSVRIESDDYLYTNVENGACASLKLARIAIE